MSPNDYRRPYLAALALRTISPQESLAEFEKAEERNAKTLAH